LTQDSGLIFLSSVILSENRFPVFGIMLLDSWLHGLSSICDDGGASCGESESAAIRKRAGMRFPILRLVSRMD
jgi:hypothetical protein